MAIPLASLPTGDSSTSPLMSSVWRIIELNSWRRGQPYCRGLVDNKGMLPSYFPFPGGKKGEIFFSWVTSSSKACEKVDHLCRRVRKRSSPAFLLLLSSRRSRGVKQIGNVFFHLSPPIPQTDPNIGQLIAEDPSASKRYFPFWHSHWHPLQHTHTIFSSKWNPELSCAQGKVEVGQFKAASFPIGLQFAEKHFNVFKIHLSVIGTISVRFPLIVKDKVRRLQKKNPAFLCLKIPFTFLQQSSLLLACLALYSSSS